MNETCQVELEFNFTWVPFAEKNANWCDTIVSLLTKFFFQAFCAKFDSGEGLR